MCIVLKNVIKPSIQLWVLHEIDSLTSTSVLHYRYSSTIQVKQVPDTGFGKDRLPQTILWSSQQTNLDILRQEWSKRARALVSLIEKVDLFLKDRWQLKVWTSHLVTGTWRPFLLCVHVEFTLQPGWQCALKSTWSYDDLIKVSHRYFGKVSSTKSLIREDKCCSDHKQVPGQGNHGCVCRLGYNRL